MKPLTYIILTVMACILSHMPLAGQNDSIPNNSFEVWIENPFQNYVEPENWSTPNPYTSVNPINIVTVEKDTVDPHSGSFSARLTSKFVATGKIPGILTLGNLEIDLVNFTGEITGGIPFQQQPALLTGYYKYSPAEGDTCLILARLYRFIPAKGKQDIIALATFRSDKDTSSWAYFSTPFEYYNDSILPDSMNIVVLSSANFTNPNVGSRLNIDDLKLDGTLGIKDYSESLVAVTVIPNPARDYLQVLTGTAFRNGLLLIFDSSGKQVGSESFSGQKIKINAGYLVSGKYFFQILENNTRKGKGSFIISK